MDWLMLQFEPTAYHLVIGAGMVYFMLRPVLAGAPYVPTGPRRARELLSFAGVRPDDVFCELGSGDGHVSVEAVRAGASRSVGYDILGTMVALARTRARLSGMAARCVFRRGDIRKLDISDATLAYCYLLPGVTDILAAGTLLTLKPGARVLCSTFEIPARFSGFRLLKKDRFGSVRAFLYERI